MRFWDANSVVPLTVSEDRSGDMRRLLTEDGDQIVWWGTRTECVSALSRKAREGAIDQLGEARARVLLYYLGAWNEILPSYALRSEAERFLGKHPLKAADALQLAAAFVWCDGRPGGEEFVCLDRQLNRAAEAEGFTVLA